MHAGSNDSKKEVEAAYVEMMNWPVPESVQNLDGFVMWTGITFVSRAEFTYTVTPDYFDMLLAHRDFAVSSEFNKAITETLCPPGDYFSYWTDRTISLNNKICYAGIFFPWEHVLVYVPATGYVDHFVQGIRE